MWRELTNNECKQWINDFYIKYKSDDDHSFYMKTLDDDFFNIQVLCKGPLWIMLSEKNVEALQSCTRFYVDWYKLNYKDYKVKEIKYFYFLTASGGKQKILVNKSNINHMFDMNKKIFSNEIYKRFYRVYWNIETGKKEEDTNLHTHALIIFHSTNKNFDRDYRGCFKKIFGNIDLQIQKFG